MTFLRPFFTFRYDIAITDLKIRLVLPRWDTNAFLDQNITKHHVWTMERFNVNLLMHFNDAIPGVTDPAEREKLNKLRDTMVTWHSRQLSLLCKPEGVSCRGLRNRISALPAPNVLLISMLWSIFLSRQSKWTLPSCGAHSPARFATGSC